MKTWKPPLTMMPHGTGPGWEARGLAVGVALAFLAGSTSATAQKRPMETGSVLVETFADSALLGMQLAAQKAARENKLPQAKARCMAAKTRAAFMPTFAAIASEGFGTPEITEANSFLASPLGRKYLKQGQAQIYLGMGAKPPERPPALTDAELQQIQAFSRTSAGRKLIVEKVMENAAARQALSQRVQELLRSCEPDKPQSLASPPTDQSAASLLSMIS